MIVPDAEVKQLIAESRTTGCEQPVNSKALYRLNASVSGVSDFGRTADGSRADVFLEGTVRGRINGKFKGIDYGLSRATGEGGAVVIHVHETIETNGGLVSVIRRGYAIPDGERYKVRAFCLFQTAIKKLNFLNTVLGLAEGYADAKSVRLSVFEML
jgi:hypothetical protein